VAKPILSVSGLDASFRSGNLWVPVVRNLSFEIAPGSTLAMVGGSGSGKSVTALAIMRLLPEGSARVSGQVSFAGRSLLDLAEREMCALRGNEIAMIFQEPMTSLNPTARVGFQIGEVLRRHRGMSAAEARAESVRLLDRVRIPAAASRVHDYPHLMSGGMRQRVMIAMALACHPKLMIADEPTTALDVTVQAQIIDLMRTLQQEEGLSMLFITHDFGVVAEIADDIVVMHQGQAVERGPAPKIFSEPKHPYTRMLLAAVPRTGLIASGDFRAETGEPASAAASAEPILRVRNLTKSFDVRRGAWGRVSARIHAIDGISFDIRAGETLSLVGESGCGKSTTGRCVIGLTRPSSGSIELNGKDLLQDGSEAARQNRRRMQMVFQDPYASLNPRMHISDSIAEPLLVEGRASRAEIAARVDNLLEAVGLSPAMRNRFPHEFSGGQRQRICIARALSVHPDLLIADEAVSALDVSIKAQIIDLLLDLQKKMGLAFLFISHDMAVVERISHRVAVMYMGEIVEMGSRSSVLGNPQHPYTKLLLSAIPVPDPVRRTERPKLAHRELVSPLRSLDHQQRRLAYRSVGPDHLVQEWE
jgi:peptide/nickel transport system ATP-binding protein